VPSRPSAVVVLMVVGSSTTKTLMCSCWVRSSPQGSWNRSANSCPTNAFLRADEALLDLSHYFFEPGAVRVLSLSSPQPMTIEERHLASRQKQSNHLACEPTKWFALLNPCNCQQATGNCTVNPLSVGLLAAAQSIYSIMNINPLVYI